MRTALRRVLAFLRRLLAFLRRLLLWLRRRRPRPPDDGELERECRRLLDELRKRCPELVPREPLEPGAATEPLPLRPERVGPLLTLAARQAAQAAAGVAVASDPDRLPRTVLWQEGPDALVVDVAGVAVEIGDGVVTVSIPVHCDQLEGGREDVDVDLVLGTPERPTGLLAAASEPRGARVVVRRWGDALTALAWQAALDAVGGVAAAAGADRDGAPLVPAALTAARDGLQLVAQARHELDRIRPGEVVSPSAARGVLR